MEKNINIMSTTLIEEIKQLQELKGWTDAELARQTGISHAMLTRLKNGERNPGSKTMKKLARIPEMRLVIYNHMTKEPTGAS